MTPVPDALVTIIIPTRGLRSRAELLQRAVSSVLHQQGVKAIPLVVLNGAHRAPEVERALRETPGVELLSLAAAGIPGALMIGRKAVRTPWFGTLDDDDILTPDALASRIRMLEAMPDHDVVVVERPEPRRPNRLPAKQQRARKATRST